MATTSFTADNLVIGMIRTKKTLQLEVGESVVRGEVLKRGVTGLVALTTLEYTQADASSVTHISTTTAQDLLQDQLIWHIAQNRMYQYVGADALAVDLSIADYTKGSLYQKINKGDIPYSVALQTVDATAAAKTIVYTSHGGLLGSELIFAVGTLADFRDGFVSNTNLDIEE